MTSIKFLACMVLSFALQQGICQGTFSEKEFQKIRKVGEIRLSQYLDDMEKLNFSHPFKQMKGEEKDKFRDLRNDLRNYYYEPKWLEISKDYLPAESGRDLISAHDYFSSANLFNYFKKLTITYEYQTWYDSASTIAGIPSWLTGRNESKEKKIAPILAKAMFCSKVTRHFRGTPDGSGKEQIFDDVIFIYWGFDTALGAQVQPQDISIFAVKAPPPVKELDKPFDFEYWRKAPGEAELNKARLAVQSKTREMIAELNALTEDGGNVNQLIETFFSSENVDIPQEMFPLEELQTLQLKDYLKRFSDLPKPTYHLQDVQGEFQLTGSNQARFSCNVIVQWTVPYETYSLQFAPSLKFHFQANRTSTGFEDFRIYKVTSEGPVSVDRIPTSTPINQDSLTALKTLREEAKPLINSFFEKLESNEDFQSLFYSDSSNIEVQRNCADSTSRIVLTPQAYQKHVQGLRYEHVDFLPEMEAIPRVVTFDKEKNYWRGTVEIEQVFEGVPPHRHPGYKDWTKKRIELGVQKQEDDSWSIFLIDIYVTTCRCTE